MQQILGSIIVIVILVLIAAVIIAICGGLPGRTGNGGGWHSSVPKPHEVPSGEGYEKPSPRREKPSVPQKKVRKEEYDYGDSDSENATVSYGNPSSSWVLELLDDDGRVQERFPVPDCSNTGVTVGRSSESDIHISGFPDMSRRHLVLRRDNGGVYLLASDYCSSNIVIDGKSVFDGSRLKDADFNEKHRLVKRSKTYLRDGMEMKLGSAVVRVSYD